MCEVIDEKGSATIYKRTWTEAELQDFKESHRLKDGTELWGQDFDDRHDEETKKYEAFAEAKRKKYAIKNDKCKLCQKPLTTVPINSPEKILEYQKLRCQRTQCHRKVCRFKMVTVFNENELGEQSEREVEGETLVHDTVRVCEA